MGMMFLEVMTTEVKAEAADKARRELFCWMDVEGYAPDGFDTTGLLS